MKIAFHGAARCVTGSKHLLTLSNGNKILLDCGMFQGMGQETDFLNRNFGFNAGEIDQLILSHAHIDHCGLIPRFVKEGFAGRIFCTPATRDLTTVLLLDSAGIQEEDTKFVNKKNAAQGKPYVAPLYTTEDVQLVLPLFETIEYGVPTEIAKGVELLFVDAGHIIGSSTVHLRITENGKSNSLSFSGDVGQYRDVILKSPQTFPQADYILLESTYGNTLHESTRFTPEILLDWLDKTCIRKKGKLIMPAFSVGRTQEILYALNQLEHENRLPKLDYFVDSPLSIETTEVVKRYKQHFNRTVQKIMETDHDPFHFNGLKYIKSVEASKQLNYHKEACVIISASGMAEAGRVKHHISNNIENSRNTILMTGYCEPRSLGGRLVAGAKEVNIYGQPHEVHAEIGAITSMSAHGDYEDLCQWLACQDAKQVKKLFLVHGDYKVQQDFKSRLIRKGFTDVEIPELRYETGLV